MFLADDGSPHYHVEAISAMCVAEEGSPHHHAKALPARILLYASDCSLLQSRDVLKKIALHFLERGSV